MYEARHYNSIKDAKLKKHWLNLQCGDDMTAFQTYEWYEMLEKEYQCNILKKIGSQIMYIEVLKNRTPMLIAPLHIQKHTMKLGAFGYRKNVYFLGMKGYTDYLNLIYCHIDKDAIAYLFQVIKERTGQSIYSFLQILEDTKFARILREYEKEGKVKRFGEENCVKLHFPKTESEYEGLISKNLKSSLRRQKNKYKREGVDLNYELIEGICDEEAISKKIEQIHNMRFREKNKNNTAVKLSSMSTKLRGTFDEIQYSIHNNKNTWLLLGKDKDEIIVYFYGMKDKNAIRIMQLGFDTIYAKYMPGNMTMMKFIRENFRKLSGFTMDFTRGEERYKYELGGIQHKIADYMVLWL